MRTSSHVAHAATNIVAVLFALFGTANASKFTVLHSFGSGADGSNPVGEFLAADSAGTLYGTTNTGGAAGAGTVFKVTTDGTETVLYSFCKQANCTDGANPASTVTMDGAGNLYGTTTGGGNFGGGTVFELTSSGREKVLYSFCTIYKCDDGDTPYAGVIFGGSGNLYGTTVSGGTSGGGDCCGTVYKLDSPDNETVLHTFGNGTDSSSPYAGLARDDSGNLYGTTSGVATADGGQVFEVTTKGDFKTLYRFCSQANCADGYQPRASLIVDSRGNLYGTTVLGGISGTNCPASYVNSCGVVFELSKRGAYRVLHTFCSDYNGNDCLDGANPQAGLFGTKDDTVLYGTTEYGGNQNYGDVFKLTGSTETILHSFGPPYANTPPFAGVIKIGRFFYGTTGEVNGPGYVYKLSKNGG